MADDSQKEDPTVLTTKQLIREIEVLKEIIFVRLDAMDKAVELLQHKADRSPTVGEMAERFDSFQTLLAEIDKRYIAEFVKLSTTTELMMSQQELALTATKEATALAMDAAERAVQKAEAAAEKRFESINEFRAQLADQQATFARTDLVSQRADSLEKKVDDVVKHFESRVADNKDRIHSVKDSIQAVENQVKGASQLWAFMLGGGTLLLVLLGFIYSLAK